MVDAVPIFAALGLTMFALGYLCLAVDAATAFLYLAIAAVAAVSGGYVTSWLHADFFVAWAFLPFFAFGVGAVLARFYEMKTAREFLRVLPRAKYSLLGRWQVLLIVLAILFGCGLTYFFAQKVAVGTATGEGASFWYGFYQSWTAGLAAFFIFGIVGLVISIHNPSKEHFKQRVAHLFGVDNPDAIEYLAREIQKTGYYCQETLRKYTVNSYDPVRKCYDVIITHESINRNFIQDVSVPDKLKLMIEFEPDDLLDPPMDAMGWLEAVDIGGVNKLEERGRVRIDEKGINEAWSISIPKGGNVKVKIKQSLMVKAGSSQQYRPAHFSEKIKIVLQYNCTTHCLPELLWSSKAGSHRQAVLLNEEMVLAQLSDCTPSDDAIEIILMPPVSSRMERDAAPQQSVPVC
ncbi:hypothetical protein HL658_03185 [Azospirillum sp. RWY-5-1]|uniref:Uncharacterized protein n=1 Tax=Azospirillum oleiclasticum TaxID=2735135 RepID=A0ABX2T3P8_9PROT|nr:hypothetical protein [Azospirillum oleiclasticum]NYZ11541.1 hypothetical protein [Azospirillum oleiclasticum]NYZ18702.1 hypothetical protein [Azospirillum oleiclasticum]